MALGPQGLEDAGLGIQGSGLKLFMVRGRFAIQGPGSGYLGFRFVALRRVRLMVLSFVRGGG